MQTYFEKLTDNEILLGILPQKIAVVEISKFNSISFFYITIMKFQSSKSMFILLVINIGGVRSVSNGNATLEDLKYQIFWLKIGNFFCSGIGIDKWHVLTAAHCVVRYVQCPHLVTAEKTNFEGSRDVYKVQKIHIHEDFKSGETEDGEMSVENDIAVLRLETLIFYGETIERIQLPTKEPPRCGICIIAGWGREEFDVINLDRRLLWADAMILSADLCLLLGSENNANQFCTIDPSGKSTALQGDSGGPLICNGILFGIISMTTGNPKLPITHTQVYSVSSLSFIDTVYRKTVADDEIREETER